MLLSSRAWPFVLLTFLQEAVVLLATSTAEGLFLKRVGSQYLPGVYLLSAVVSASASLLYALVRGRWDGRRLAVATPLAFGGLMLAIAAPLERNVTPVFYLYFAAVSVFVMIARIQLWLVINRRFTTREAKRVFPLLTGAGLAGSILGGLSLQLFPASWGPTQYQGVTAAFTFLYLAVFLAGARDTAPGPAAEGAADSPAAGLARMREAFGNGFVRSLGLLVLAQIAILTLVDYQFNRVCDARFPEESALIGFFGMFRSVSNMAAFLSQMFVTHRVIAALGIGFALLVTPLAAIGYGWALVASFGFYTGVAAKLTGRFLQRTLHGSLYQVLFNAVDEPRRDAAMLACDGIAYSVGTVSASALLWCVVPLGPQGIDLVILIAAVLFLIVALGLRRAYLHLLVEHFRGAQRPALESPAQLPGAGSAQVRKGSLAALARLGTRAAVPYLLQGLEDPSPEVRIEAVRGIAALGDESVLPELVARLDREQDDRVRSQLLRAFGRFKQSGIVDGLLGFLQDRVPRIRADLVEILGGLPHRRHAERLLPALEDPEVRVRANAILALWRIGDDRQVRAALLALRKLLSSRDPARRSAGAFVLGRIGNRMAGQLLLAMMAEETDARVLRNTVVGLARTGGEGLADPLLVAFSRAAPEDRPVFMAALKRVGRGDAEPFVRASLTGAPAVRILAIEMLGHVPPERAVETLLELSRDADPEIRVSALRSLTRTADSRVDARLREVLRGDADERVRATALRRIGGQQARRLFPELLRGLETATDRERANTLEALTSLAARVLSGEETLSAVAASLSGQRPSAGAEEPSPGRDFVMRFLDAAAGMLQSPAGRVAANAAYALWKLGDPRGAEALVGMLGDARVKSALHCIGKTGDARFSEPVSALLASTDETIRARAASVLERVGARWDDIFAQLGGGDERGIAELLEAYSAGGERIRHYLRRALERGRESLAAGLADAEPLVRLQVLEAMQVLGEDVDRPMALALLELPSESLRLKAAAVLARADWKEPPEAFRRFWKASIDGVYRYVWCAALLARVAPVGLPSVMGLAQAAARRARRAVRGLVATFDVFDPEKSFGPIAESLDEADPVARARALEALENLVPAELSRPLVPVLESEERAWGELAERYFVDHGRPPSLDALFGLVREDDAELREAAGVALLDLSERYVTQLLKNEVASEVARRAEALAAVIERRRPSKKEARPEAA
ncbi:MAG: HEAT repeat domain-containing protein [Candidatus Wallbacteria bacterium]|nr:HEAT repeat domain-containing protein [Candidatus Wallbacteria bacterium]